MTPLTAEKFLYERDGEARRENARTLLLAQGVELAPAGKGPEEKLLGIDGSVGLPKLI